MSLLHLPPAESGCYVTNTEDGNQALAFGIVLAAGLSTTIGGLISFLLPRNTKSKNLWLASFLGIASGVMIYVSFVEIFAGKSMNEFKRCNKGVLSKYATLYSTLCFFAGIAITAILDKLLHIAQNMFFARKDAASGQDTPSDKTGVLTKLKNMFKRKTEQDSLQNIDTRDLEKSTIDSQNNVEDNIADQPEPRSVRVPISGMFGSLINGLKRNKVDGDEQSVETTADYEEPTTQNSALNEKERRLEDIGFGGNELQIGVDGEETKQDSIDGEGEMIASMYQRDADSARLIRMGLFAGFALAFHNFPEGLATYVSVLNDPQIGASVAIATAVHNIPEGICVAMPIYYATGSRWKALFWTFLSGMTELLGALLGYWILVKVVTPEVYGVLFGIVGGMMVYISIKELIPTAHKYDPHDQVTSLSFIFGMAIMASSIILFAF